MARIDKDSLTRLEIVAEASTQFLEKGYSKTTVSSISKALEMSSGNLTFHYPTKEHLLAELVDALCAFHWKRMEKEANDDISSILALCLELTAMAGACEDDPVNKDFLLSAYGCTLTVTDTAETKGTVVNYFGSAFSYISGKLIILDTTDCFGKGEGHEPWQISRGADAAADAGTIGTTGTEDIVLPADCVSFVLSSTTEVTLLPEIGDIVIHRHTWADATCTAPKTCTNCGATEGDGLGHSFGEDDICLNCGALKNPITINMTDSYGDGWSGNAIEVYENGVLVATATFDDGKSATCLVGYDPEKIYKFCWVKDNYSHECSFEILIGCEVVFEASTADCAEYIDGYMLYPVCDHSFGEDGKCTGCGMMIVCSMNIGGTVTAYTDFEEAMNAASAAEAATLTLHQDVEAGFYKFTGGNMTVDLNGKTFNGRFVVIGCTLTVTDTAETKGTVVNYGGTAFTHNSGKLIILDTTDFLGAGEGHEPWQISRGAATSAAPSPSPAMPTFIWKPPTKRASMSPVKSRALPSPVAASMSMLPRKVWMPTPLPSPAAL